MGGARVSSVIFYFDFSSPFAYLGSTQIERVAAAAGATVSWRPLLLGGLFRAIGTPDVPLFAMSEPRRRYQARDLAHWADHLRVPFRWPSRFPIRTAFALRLALASGEALVPLSHALYRAAWADDRDLADRTVLGEIAASLGLDAPALLRASEEPAIKQRLRDLTDEAARSGVFGVPSFLVGEELFFGQDRLEFVADALRRLPSETAGD
ncbi:MAG: 2-hydroxychromene-2-carboxylate isomerase [Myxococcales bacterium]|nr:2-hydroxychromene-2-carboxylate isomerase [Myxococcales bacterium]